MAIRFKAPSPTRFSLRGETFLKSAFEPLVERHLYGGIRRLGSKLTEEYADYFEPEP